MNMNSFDHRHSDQESSAKFRATFPPLGGPHQRSTGQDFFRPGNIVGGKYRILKALGKGGFGVVYMASDRQGRQVVALKTFRDELMASAKARKAFRKEALLWVGLERHPFIVPATCVTEFSGRLIVEMEYVPSDQQGRVTLADHLRASRCSLGRGIVLTWAVQLCLGMEHALDRSVRCHRDIKPGNLLIAPDRRLKISDFGLAGALDAASPKRGDSMVSWGNDGVELTLGMSILPTMGQMCCGTPGYMAPEVYRGERADERSDLYSFGVVLWQMATGAGLPPFVEGWDGNLERFMRRVYEQQMGCKFRSVKGRLGKVIDRCLHPDPGQRFGSFGELREHLEPLLKRETGKVVEVSFAEEKTAAFWNAKGANLDILGRSEEALIHFDKALQIDPNDPTIWCNKGKAMSALGRQKEALDCYDRALESHPRLLAALYNKANLLSSLGRREEALVFYDQALQVDPMHPWIWNNKGVCLRSLGRLEEALVHHEKAVQLDPGHAEGWSGGGSVLEALGRREEALVHFDQALRIDPRFLSVWHKKVRVLQALGRKNEMLDCYRQIVQIEPRNVSVWKEMGTVLDELGQYEESLACYEQLSQIDPNDPAAWCDKGKAMSALGRLKEAVVCYDQALKIHPRLLAAWYNKGNALRDLGQELAALACYDEALKIDPMHPWIWNNKGLVLASLGRTKEALVCYDQALKGDPPEKRAWKNRGDSLSLLGRYEEALDCYSKGLEMNPRNADAWYKKALIEEGLGRKYEAAKSYRKFIDCAPVQSAREVALAQQRLQELEE